MSLTQHLRRQSESQVFKSLYTLRNRWDGTRCIYYWTNDQTYCILSNAGNASICNHHWKVKAIFRIPRLLFIKRLWWTLKQFDTRGNVILPNSMGGTSVGPLEKPPSSTSRAACHALLNASMVIHVALFLLLLLPILSLHYLLHWLQ